MAKIPEAPKSHPLSRKQRNEIFGWVRDTDWDPKQFRWGEVTLDVGHSRPFEALIYKREEENRFGFRAIGPDETEMWMRPGIDDHMMYLAHTDWRRSVHASCS